MPMEADFFQATYPVNPRGQTRTHELRWLNPCALDPRMLLNQTAIMEADTFTGMEAWDYQNPYVWASAGLLSVPSLVPDYPAFADTPQSVAANIAAHGYGLEK